MGWDPTTHRLCKFGGVKKIAANGQGDLQLAVRSSSMSEINLICNGEIATFARWHPVRSNRISLPTEYDRRSAGREAGDMTRQFGVHASGFGSNVLLDDIHACSFEYERPTVEDVQQGVCYLRVFDFFNPEDNYTGYRSDAFFDFSGKIWNTGQTNLVIPVDGRDEIQITYDPHDIDNNGRLNEMISVKDFLTPDSQVATPFDPLEMYPCVLITQNNYHFIHCLYTSTGSSLTKLKNAVGNWRIPGFSVGSGSGVLHQGEPAVISIFLSSERYLLGPQTGTDISDWIAMAIGSSGDLWVATFAPVPGACGEPCYIGQGPSSGVNVSIIDAQFNVRKTTLQVFLAVGNAEMTSAFSVRVNCNSEQASTHQLLIRADTTNITDTFNLSFDFPDVMFVSGQDYTFEVDILKNGSSVGQQSRSFRLTY